MVWDIYGPSLEVIWEIKAMVYVFLLCGFDMGYSPTYQTHRYLSLSLCCLLLWDDYIFHKGPYILHSFLLGNGMVCPIAIPYDPHPVLWDNLLGKF